MDIIIRPRSRVATLIEQLATSIDDKYHYMPCWFMKLPDGNFQVFHIETLPDELKEKILDGRNRIKKT